MTLCLQDDGQLGKAEARTAVLLGDGKPVPAEFGGRRPDIGRMRRTVLQRRAGGGPAVQSGQLTDHGVGEISVFVADGQC